MSTSRGGKRRDKDSGGLHLDDGVVGDKFKKGTEKNVLESDKMRARKCLYYSTNTSQLYILLESISTRPVGTYQRLALDRLSSKLPSFKGTLASPKSALVKACLAVLPIASHSIRGCSPPSSVPRCSSWFMTPSVL